ncbi:endonuclease [Sedimentitalea sp.]|uniref:endonuclease n=1 Tax=Sedimentitalea sp. TaxID=2048915 RepID=UPI003299F53A
MSEDNSFDDLKARYAEQVERVQGMIAEKPEAERPRLEKSLNGIQARLAHMQPLGLRSVTLTERPSEGGVYSHANIDGGQLDRLREPEVRAQVETALRGTGISSGVVIARMESGAQNAALERQWIADDLAHVAARDGLNLERKEDVETAREILNRAHVQLGTTLERAGILREDGVVEDETVAERFHYHSEAARTMETTIRQEMRLGGLTEQQIEEREWQVASRAERRIETEQRTYLAAHPDLLARPGAVIDRSEPYREHITDRAQAEKIVREIDRMFEGRDVRMPVADAVTADFRERYPDMPDHLARGLGATYATVIEVRDTDAIAEVRRENELRETLGTGVSEDPRVAVADARSVVAEITRGVSDQFDKTPDAFTSFEPVVLERSRVDNDSAYSGSGVDLSAALQELRADLEAKRLDATASHRAEILIRDTIERYSDRMTRDVERAYSDRLSAHQDAQVMGSDGDKIVTEIEYEGIRSERDGLSSLLKGYGHGAQGLRAEPDEIARVVAHDRTGNLSSPFADADQRLSYREAVERSLNGEQIERLRDGDADVLMDQVEDRLDRLYAAKAYMQSDAATANSAAVRTVVEEIANREYELHRADLADGETERGETH